jgi:hypothetical protein
MRVRDLYFYFIDFRAYAGVFAAPIFPVTGNIMRLSPVILSRLEMDERRGRLEAYVRI